jgi:hypothetical protein
VHAAILNAAIMAETGAPCFHPEDGTPALIAAK